MHNQPSSNQPSSTTPAQQAMHARVQAAQAHGSTPASGGNAHIVRNAQGQPKLQQVPAWARHNNPQVAKVLAAVAKLPGTPQAQAQAALAKYGSAAALCRALGCNGKANQRAVRQVLRDAGMGVGRGNTYNGAVGSKLAKAAKANAAAAAKAARQRA